MLSIDGEVIAQSYGILLYCGKVGGLYPADPAEAIKVDEVLGVVEDLVQAVFRYRGDDKDKMREEREKYAKIDVPRYVGGLEKRLETFGSGPWVVGDGITIADLAVFHMVTTLKCGLLDFLDTDMYDGYDRAMKSYNAVRDHPKVVEWYKKHPIKMVL